MTVLAQEEFSQVESVPRPPRGSSNSTEKGVSVLIVTWNSEAWIHECLDALPEAAAGIPYHVLLHDNASADHTLSAVSNATGSRIEISRSDTNLGFAAGLNAGLREATGEYLLVLNPDCKLTPGSIESLAGYLDANRTVSGVVPLLIGTDGVPQREFQLRRFPTLATFATEILLLDKVWPRNRVTQRHRYADLDITRAQPVEQPAAAAIMLRREVVEKVGLFDERFSPAWFEDVDYCRRLADGGHTLHLVPAATAVHHGGVSRELVGFEQFHIILYRNLSLYASKWFSRSDQRWLRSIVLVGMLLRMAVTIVTGATGSMGRRTALRTYLTIFRKVLAGWPDPSPSS